MHLLGSASKSIFEKTSLSRRSGGLLSEMRCLPLPRTKGVETPNHHEWIDDEEGLEVVWKGKVKVIGKDLGSGERVARKGKGKETGDGQGQEGQVAERSRATEQDPTADPFRGSAALACLTEWDFGEKWKWSAVGLAQDW